MMYHLLDDLTPLTWSPITRADIPDLLAVITAIEHLDDTIERHTIDDLIGFFEAEGSEPEFATLLGRDRGGSPAAWAWNRRIPNETNPVRFWLRGGVHPVWRSQQIGRRLFAWQLDQAREWFMRDCQDSDGPMRFVAYTDEKLTGHQKLLAAAGLQPERWFVDMVRHTLDDIPEATELAGVRLVPLTEDRFEPVRLAHNEAFERAWGAEPVSADAWRATLARPAARPQWSWVAVNADDESEVVGYAICSSFENAAGPGGWIDHLGVRQQWRQRGIASAVVSACLRTFAERGLTGAGLGVDAEEPEQALRLYKRLGYEAADTMIMYVREEESVDGGSLQMGNHQA